MGAHLREEDGRLIGKTILKYGASWSTAFIICLVWQLVDGVGTRLFVERSAWFGVQLFASTLLWFYGTRLAVAKPVTLVPILLGTVLGGLLSLWVI